MSKVNKTESVVYKTTAVYIPPEDRMTSTNHTAESVSVSPTSERSAEDILKDIRSSGSLVNKALNFVKGLWTDFKNSIRQVSIDSIGWAALIALHLVTVPSMIGLMSGLTDYSPPIDMVIILWGALGLFYIKSILEKNIVSIVIIGLGFLAQSVMMALVFFK